MEVNGYHGKTLDLLLKSHVTIGDHVCIESTRGKYCGILIPRYEHATPDRIVVKLESGYNTGVSINKIKSIRKVEKPALANSNKNSSTNRDQSLLSSTDLQLDNILSPDEKSTNLPPVSLISTGGTISSRIDYRTGGVSSALTASELYESVPELREYSSIDPEVLFTEYSENLTPEHWTIIAKTVHEKILSQKYKGIIISHGTDTMHYTSAALSFALQNLPIPIILVGAQRSSDRPSSDAALNLLGAAVIATKSNIAGVLVVMHNSISDDVISCHLGTRVRKNHTSRRDAFESIDVDPVALVKGENIELSARNSQLSLHNRRNGIEKIVAKPNFDKRVSLIRFYPGFDPRIIDYCVQLGNKIIILEGTGLGHVSRDCIPSLQNAVRNKVLVFITSQCIWGRTSLDVYETGRDLLNIGVIPLRNMLTETATVKAMWALANCKNSREIKQVMQENIANEITTRIPIK
ncbi:MAG: Glu-tRNA(Gln) amidotransferase subunit GatD [Nitrososphaerota archaeon]